MSKVIIGIHGLANKPPEKTLAEWWEQAMLEGLRKNAGINMDSLNFHSVYWADAMYAEPDQNPDAYHEAEGGALKRYDDGWLDIVRAKASSINGKMWDSAKTLFGIDKIADMVLEKKLQDLHKYYTDSELREELRKRLKNVILDNKGDRIMLVAHSMGTIIAYDVLRQLGKEDPNIKIDHFVTIGSPLGLPHVKYKISEESPLVRTPSIVKKWTNLADRRDPVAIDTHLADDYDSNEDGVKVRDDLVINDWGKINHKSYGYLRTPEFTDLLKKAM
ncbi:hypothetical protein DJ030_17595 [bacterium endosymbiont of Escarpia laminata]|nr:MAG: hypothetical protein DJ030_17595 [bacterium endosymbiont of Escarpia laminata]RLJ18266.1 MAG: hypothetical protein DJ031_11390 [bacterium endosymbiont of Escarpia laminata]